MFLNTFTLFTEEILKIIHPTFIRYHLKFALQYRFGINNLGDLLKSTAKKKKKEIRKNRFVNKKIKRISDRVSQDKLKWKYFPKVMRS
ncbi:hypothetical protein BpHYR1_052358 [Brachionus plicatilis]|uniref:Uncharacterized protein n=1 Tax=Brachionus plicatilis TaxID=10195 RepID=A0A3M7T1S0_BRAPC|nr:hypothetical protein BpHYR1_052358 [Brachionus plicatilis]